MEKYIGDWQRIEREMGISGAAVIATNTFARASEDTGGEEGYGKRDGEGGGESGKEKEKEDWW
jgi:hypothetical protein